MEKELIRFLNNKDNYKNISNKVLNNLLSKNILLIYLYENSNIYKTMEHCLKSKNFKYIDTIFDIYQTAFNNFYDEIGDRFKKDIAAEKTTNLIAFKEELKEFKKGYNFLPKMETIDMDLSKFYLISTNTEIIISKLDKYITLFEKKEPLVIADLLTDRKIIKSNNGKYDIQEYVPESEIIKYLIENYAGNYKTAFDVFCFFKAYLNFKTSEEYIKSKARDFLDTKNR